MKIHFPSCAVLLITLIFHSGILASRIFAQTMVLQQGLREYSGATEYSNGMTLRFDISVLPRDAIVHSARLELYPSAEPSGEGTEFKVLILREPLDSQGKPGMADSMTKWNLRPGTPTWAALDLAPTLKAWHDTPTSNHGLAFLPLTELDKAPWIGSSSEDKVHRPRLTIGYNTISSGPLSISRQDAARICMCLRGRLTIQKTGAFSPVNWVISSLEGKQIRPLLTDATAEAAHLDMRGYPKGLYHVALKNKAGQTLHTRIMVD